MATPTSKARDRAVRRTLEEAERLTTASVSAEDTTEDSSPPKPPHALNAAFEGRPTVVGTVGTS